MFIWTFLLRITHTIISQSYADSSWITLYIYIHTYTRTHTNTHTHILLKITVVLHAISCKTPPKLFSLTTYVSGVSSKEVLQIYLSFSVWPHVPTHCRCRGSLLPLITLTLTPHSIGQPCTRDRPSQRPLPDNTQHSQERDIHAHGGIRTRNPRNWAAADPRLRARGHRDQRYEDATSTKY